MDTRRTYYAHTISGDLVEVTECTPPEIHMCVDGSQVTSELCRVEVENLGWYTSLTNFLEHCARNQDKVIDMEPSHKEFIKWKSQEKLVGDWKVTPEPVIKPETVYSVMTKSGRVLSVKGTRNGKLSFEGALFNTWDGIRQRQNNMGDPLIEEP